MDFKAAIFDMDGTLLDSMRMWDNLSLNYLKRHGVDAPADLSDKLGVLGMRRAAEYIMENYLPGQTVEDICRGIDEMLDEFYSYEAVIKPGAKEFLQKLANGNIPMALLSATGKAHLHTALRRFGMEEFFNVGIFSTEELKMSKAYPETFLKMAEMMNVSPEDCAVFEDAPYAAQSAALAGCQVYGIWDLERTAAEVEKCAKKFIRSWDELL